MEKRPRLKLQLTPADKTLEVIGWISIIALCVLTFTNYSNLPETIPTHFNGAGEADGFGEKTTIFTLPLIALVSFIGMTVLNKFPHLFNYPTKITQDNAFKQYTSATRMIRYLKIIVVLIFGLITFKTIETANGNADGLGASFLPLTMGLTFIPVIYYLIKSFKTKQLT